MQARIVWCTFFAVCWATLALSAPTRDFALCNLLAQLAIFVPFANIPAWRNNRLSYVDFAWPAGLVAIGAQLVLFAETRNFVTWSAAGIYALVGLRMAIWASHMYRPGVLTRDLPRYEYQRQRWARAGFRSERFSVQYEILVQAMANMSFLAVPAYLIAGDGSRSFDAWAAACLVAWLAAYVFESVADVQKRRYSAGHRKGVCDVGLWRYSRHPNYFGQWVQWIALVALAAPSLLALRGELHLVALAVLALSLAWVVYLMYSTLVYYTGAVPAEHFSRLKRPDYAGYQATVNRFIPGPRRTRSVA